MGRKRETSEKAVVVSPLFSRRRRRFRIETSEITALRNNLFFCFTGIELMEVLTNYDANSLRDWNELTGPSGGALSFSRVTSTALNAYQIPVQTLGTDLICCDVSFED